MRDISRKIPECGTLSRIGRVASSNSDASIYRPVGHHRTIVTITKGTTTSYVELPPELSNDDLFYIMNQFEDKEDAVDWMSKATISELMSMQLMNRIK